MVHLAVRFDHASMVRYPAPFAPRAPLWSAEERQSEQSLWSGTCSGRGGRHKWRLARPLWPF